MIKLNLDFHKSYNLFIKGIYLKKHFYKGQEFTVTNCDLIKIEDSNIDFFNYKYTANYDWEITISLSILNKVKMSYKDYFKTFEYNKNNDYSILEEMIQKEIMINRELSNESKR